MLRVVPLLLVLLGCARRVEPVVGRPSPTCASRYDLRDRVEDGTLIIAAASSAPCAEQRSADIEFSRVRLEPRETCPAAGSVVFEVGATERPLLADYAATLDERTKASLTRTLRAFLTSGMTSARAYVVRCATPKWLLVATRRVLPEPDREPQAMLYEVTPEAPTTSAEAPLPETPLATGTCEESLDVGDTVWVGRRLGTGMLPGPSHLEQWTLGRAGQHARLVVQEFTAPREGPPDDVQPQGTFRCRRSVAWEGTVTGSTRLRFELAQPPRGPTLSLTCSQRTVVVVAATARRVRVPSRIEGCNASRWDAPATGKLRVLECAEGSESRFFLSERPGVEHVTFDNDDCGDLSRGLRSMPTDGGVAPAVKLSEQPPAFVPAHLRRTK